MKAREIKKGKICNVARESARRRTLEGGISPFVIRKSNAYLPTFPPDLYPPSPPDESYAPERIATCSALFSFVVEASGAVNNRWSTRL